MKKLFIFILCVIVIPAMVIGQLKKQDTPVQIRNELIQPANNQYLGLSLFDPARLTMSHSVSMSYFSMGGKGLSQSVYLNTLQYQIASPLMLSVQWGIQNFPYNSLAKDNPAFQNGFFLSGAELKYQPSKNFEMSFQYSSMPGYYNRNSFYNPYRYFQTRSWWNDDQE